MRKIFKRAFFTFIILHSVLTISAQQTNLDSLYSVWQDESQTDSTRVIAYRDYIQNGFLFTNPDTAFSLAEDLVTFAKENNYTIAKGQAYHLQGWSFEIKGNYSQALEYYHRRIKINEEIGNKTGIAATLNNIGLMYYDQEKYSKSIGYHQRSLKLRKEIGNKKDIAVSLFNIGLTYKAQGDYPSALDHYQRSLKIRERLGDKQDVAASLNNIGIIYYNQGDYPSALDHYQRSLKIRERLGDKQDIAASLNNIGIIYYDQGNYSFALDYHQHSLKIREKIGDKLGIATSLNNIGLIYNDQGNYPSALDYHQRSLKIKEEIGDKLGLAQSINNIGIIYYDQGKYAKSLEYHQRSLKISEEIGDEIGEVNSICNIGRLLQKQGKYHQAILNCQKSLNFSKKIGSVVIQKESCSCLYKAYKALGNGSKALAYHEQMLVLEDSLHSEETVQALQQMEFDKQVSADSIANAEKGRLVEEAHKEEIREREKTRNISIGIGGLILLIAGGLFARLRYVRKSKAIIEKEKDRSENLLLNILPAEIAEELKEKGKADARDFDMVSILFSDFIGFTEASAKLTARDLVYEINTCFEAFDGIMEKFKVEKIKTIGDSYMAAGGLPKPTDDSLKNTVLAALEMQAFITSRKAKNDKLGKSAFEMRVGIHTGPVVAGIVGVKKFQYDIWGDTVNTASRMESAGVVGKVNISQSTYQILKNDADFSFESRGKIKAKGKGEMEMWFVSMKS